MVVVPAAAVVQDGAQSVVLVEERNEYLPRPVVLGVARDGLVEVTLDGDHQMDVLRDLIAELGLPLYRLTTRLTSLDEVFLRLAGSPA